MKQKTLTGDILKPRPDSVADGAICERCGVVNDLQTHHIRYVPEQKVTLCRGCHSKVHQIDNSPFSPKQDANELFMSPSESSAAPESATVTVKQINNNSYFYWNWRDGENIQSEYICSVSNAPDHHLFSGECGD